MFQTSLDHPQEVSIKQAHIYIYIYRKNRQIGPYNLDIHTIWTSSAHTATTNLLTYTFLRTTILSYSSVPTYIRLFDVSFLRGLRGFCVQAFILISVHLCWNCLLKNPISYTVCT